MIAKGDKVRAREIGKLGGRKPGALTAVRKMEIAERRSMEKIVYRKTKLLMSSAFSLALGQIFVYKIIKLSDTKSEHLLVTDPKEIEKALNLIAQNGTSENGEYFYVTTKEPDIRAIEALVNRGFGKPKESITVEGDIKFSLKTLMEVRNEIDDQVLNLPLDQSDALMSNDTTNNSSDELL